MSRKSLNWRDGSSHDRFDKLAIITAASLTVLNWRQTSRAATATWLGATDSNWATNTDWSPATAPGSTSSTTNTDIAIFNGAGGGHTAVTVDSNRNIDDIIFDTSGAAAYTFSGGSLLGTSGGEILMNSTVGSSEVFNTPLSTEGSLFSLVNNASSTSATLDYSGAITAVPGGTIYLGGSNTGQNILNGSISDSTGKKTAVVKNGSGTWLLEGNETYSGSTYILGGTLQIPTTFAGTSNINNDGGTLQITGSISKTSAIGSYGSTTILSGNGQVLIGGFAAQDGASATIDNTAAIFNNRIVSGGILLASGTFNYISGNGVNSEQNSGLALEEGANVINLFPNSGGSTVITGAMIQRDIFVTMTNGTLLLTGSKIGSTPGAGVTNFVVTAAGTGCAPLGGGGAVGTTNISIESFAVIHDTSLAGNAQYGLVTGVGSANGLRALSASEYANSISDTLDNASTLRNVNLTSTSSVNGQATTINAARLDTGGGINGSGTLTVNSGAILALPGNTGVSVANLNFGPQEGIFHAIGDLTVSGNISGSGGFTKTGPGTLYLSKAGTLSYTGKTAVNQGEIRFGAANQIAGGFPFVLNGGSIDLNGFNETLGLTGGLYAGSGSQVINSNNASPVTLTIHPATTPINNFRGTIGATNANNIAINLDMGGAILELSHANNYIGATTITSGALGLDFAEPDSATNNILPASTQISCSGEIVAYEGATAATQTVSGVTMNPGVGAIVETGDGMLNADSSLPAAPLQFNLGALGRTVGGVAQIFTGPNGGGYTTSTPNTNGIIGGWATLNGQDWAVSNGAGDITAYSAYTNDTWLPASNVTVTLDSTQTNATANSLHFAAPASHTITLSGTCVLSSGGILVGISANASPQKIQGGTLEGSAGGDLIATVAVTSTKGNSLEIDSTIADNGSSTALTLAGGGTMQLTGANTYTGATYIDYGTLKISSNANLGLPAAGEPVILGFGTSSTLATSSTFALDNAGKNPRPIILSGYGGTIDVAPSTTLTIDGLISGSPYGKLSFTDSGTAVITNPSNTFAGTLAAGPLTIGSSTAVQYMTIQTNSSINFASGIGQVYMGGLSGSYGGLTLADLGSNPITLILGGSNQNTTYGGPLNCYGGIQKIGTGTMTFSGYVNNSLFATISNGALAFSGTASLSSGSYLSNSASLVFNTGSTTNNITIVGNGTTSIATGVSVVAKSFTQTSLVNNGSLQITQNGTVGPISGTGTLAIGSSSTTATLQLTAGSGLSTLAALTLTTGSTLNIANNHLIINYGTGPDPIASIAAWIASGYAGGSWTGNGITSTNAQSNAASYGIGYADSADPGNPANLSSGEIEISYTLLGDVNLDGKVNGTDFAILASNFNHAVSGWDEGDSNYDGKANGSDFAYLAMNFNKGSSQSAVNSADVSSLQSFAAANGLIADVPEPACPVIMLVSMVGTLTGRRRHYAESSSLLGEPKSSYRGSPAPPVRHSPESC